jgi:hypothetical protein
VEEDNRVLLAAVERGATTGGERSSDSPTSVIEASSKEENSDRGDGVDNDDDRDDDSSNTGENVTKWRDSVDNRKDAPPLSGVDNQLRPVLVHMWWEWEKKGGDLVTDLDGTHDLSQEQEEEEGECEDSESEASLEQEGDIQSGSE